MTIDKDEGEVTDEDEGAESEKKKNNKKVITSLCHTDHLLFLLFCTLPF